MRLLWFWVILACSSWCYGCLEQERTALLQLKASINYPNGTSLPSWEEVFVGEVATNCCEWEGIKCSTVTGRVIQLSLNYTRLRWTLDDWYLNASMFLPFEELKSLYLPSNSLAGWIENEGFERLATLRSLENLDLFDNKLNISILSTLVGIKTLKSLSLGRNSLGVSMHDNSPKKLWNMSNLEVLDLSHNNLNNNIISSLRGFSSLRSLNLGNNALNGSIDIQDLAALNNLEELLLYGNELHSFLNNKGPEKLWNMSNLEVLDLSYNNLNNNIISSLRGFSSLRSLNLGYNALNGSIDIQDLAALNNLEELDLSGNELHSFLTNQGFNNLNSLENLFLDESLLDLKFLQNMGNMTSLKILSLRWCFHNHTQLPCQGLCELRNLRGLDLSYNMFEGDLPSCFGNLTSLQFLDLSSNQFTGNIGLSPIISLTSLQDLILSNNHFKVPISFRPFFNLSKLEFINIGNFELMEEIESEAMIPRFQLKFIGISGCRLDKPTKAFPTFLYYQYELRAVDISYINLETKFPNWLFTNNTRLKAVRLVNNSLTGPFQLSDHNENILVLDISKNHFHGRLPTNIGTLLPHLKDFNVSENAFTGSIPSSLGDLNSLQYLDLSYNQFSGGIPEHLAMGCRSLWFLKLTRNNLTGQILPRNSNLTSLRYLYLDYNHFTGKIPESLSRSSYLSLLEISHNYISKGLPRWLGNMSSLRYIAMSNNLLEGSIPVSFCRLDNLQFLELSENNISGTIPSCLNPSSIEHVHLFRNQLRGPMTRAFYNSSSLVLLDLRENFFTGRIPNWVGSLSKLSILLLKDNSFEGSIPIQICQLKQLSMIDLSHNNLSGSIPSCLINIAFNTTYGKSGFWSRRLKQTSYSMVLSSLDDVNPMVHREFDLIDYDELFKEDEVEFTTKSRSYTYKGIVLELMSAIDLSCNRLIGEIPPEIGNLSQVHGLNLSHNSLKGPIPSTFSNLKQIESLDLSYNDFSGKIPPQLTNLNYLNVFIVAHNNLSGKTPDMTAQFSTFNESSYEGNPFLCGPPLLKSCAGTGLASPLPRTSNDDQEDDGFIDMGFYVCFAVAYMAVLLAIAIVLYINPYWRRAWFQFIEKWITIFYYLIVDCFGRLF